MKKLFIIDTNVMIHDPKFLEKFDDNFLVVPTCMLEELDKLKTEHGNVGYNAREAIRNLEFIINDTTTWHPLENNGQIAFLTPISLAEPLEKAGMRNTPDNQILSLAFFLDKEAKENLGIEDVIIVSKDVSLRIKANSFSIHAQDYNNDKVNIDELYCGHSELFTIQEEIDRFYKGYANIAYDSAYDLTLNECVTFINKDNIKQTGLAVNTIDGIRAIPKQQKAYDLIPRNREQRFALNLLLDDNIKLVTLIGKAGTGKTLLALAAGLQKVTEDKRYRRILVSRPVIPMGKDMGYLPGELEDKLMPWMQPIYDNIETLMSEEEQSIEKKVARIHPVEELKGLGYLEIGALTYIRGRSIPKMFIIIDEAQNLTPHEVKTIITRAGEGTKIVLTGDPYQIDNPYVDAHSNGLVYTVEKMKNSHLFGHITLVNGERSELAEIASNLM